MNHTNHTTINVEHLPEIVLEYILCQVSLYSDLKHCMLVNRRWYNLSKAAVRKVQRDLQHALINRQILWRHMLPEPGPKISERYAHSCCVNGDSMYVFGGCTTANTTFNDLWRLDLATRRWIRPLATGTYPSPKACATLVSHKDNLVLFGGWTHTSPYSPYQNRKIFGHLHVYSISTNRWTQIVTTCTSPSLGGHTATLQNDEMVVFGGLECPNGAGIFSSTNDVWVLNLKEWTWRKQATTSPQPHPRYGHSQVSIDNKNILIFGGCGGPNMLFNDVWLLRKSVEVEEPWEWIELTVLKKENGTPHLAFHPVCKVGNHVVVLSRGQQYRSSPSCLPQVLRVPSRIWVPPQADSSTYPSGRRQQRISSPSRNAMCIYVLDIGEATEKRSVSWVPFPTESPMSFGPEEMILFSLVLGRGELIMFGGIQKDLVSKRQEGEAVPDVVSNSLHFICPEQFSL
ncbi:F-box only protein 42-like isoform X2 [Tachypleus tridentatus]|uniref:F-box only protein 42-like isoform X2 n=1 Tax=Tachypleus tridentatus TaxID=6853 RepID=UPI003FD30452